MGTRLSVTPSSLILVSDSYNKPAFVLICPKMKFSVQDLIKIHDFSE